MMVVHCFYMALLLGFDTINYTWQAPVNIESKQDLSGDQSGHHQCRRLMNYEEIHRLLAYSPCATDIDHENHTETWRMKRDRDADSSSHVYALQSTINDHRTIIDDHRTMINYLMNNTVNVTQLNQQYAEQHMKSSPIWKSWRDVSLILLLTVVIGMIIYLVAMQLQPVELLTKVLLQRHQTKKRQQHSTIVKKASMVRRDPSDMELDNISTVLERNHMRY